MSYLHPTATASQRGMVKVAGGGETAESTANKGVNNGYASLNGSGAVEQLPANAELASIAGLTSAADRVAYFTGSGTASLATFTATARSILDDASVADVRDTIELGTSDSPTFTGLTLSAALAMGNAKITGLGTPTNGTDAATKSYVDSAVSGLTLKDPARAATTEALPASTYNNGSSGVGATLTGDSNGALSAQDGITLSQNNRLLVKDQSSEAENGLYELTQVGDGSNPFILTRVIGFDDADSIVPGSFVFIEAGTVNGDTGWVMSQNGSITVGTTDVTFTQFSSAAAVIGGDGINKSGNTLSVDLATNPGLQFTSNKLDLHLQSNKGLAKDATGLEVVVGNGISVGASGVEVDLALNPGLEFNSGALRAKVQGAIDVDANGLLVVFAPNEGVQDIGNGIGLKLDGSTLAISSSGVKVDTDGITSTEVDLTGDFLFTGDLGSGGRVKQVVAPKTSNYTATDNDHIIPMDPTSGNLTLTLPAASGRLGREFIIKHAGGSSNTVTVDGNASETIDGQATQVINTGGSITIICDGNNWFII